MSRISDPGQIDLTKYKYIIVGSGPAGGTLAKRLTEKGQSCLILETGEASYNQDIQSAYTSMECYGHYGNNHWARHWVRAYGGTSMIWGGWCAPLDARDFRHWPIELSDLAAHYDIAAEILERDPIINTYREPHIAGFDYKPFSNAFGGTNFGALNAAFLEANAETDVALGATLSRMVTNEARTRITAIEISALNGTKTRFTLSDQQTLILGAGAIGNAQLMLTPTDNSDVGVGNEADMVGRCLMEHPHLLRVARFIGRRGFEPALPPDPFGEYIPALIPTDDIYEQTGGLGFTIDFTETDRNYEDPIERHFMSRFAGDLAIYDMSVRAEMRPEHHNRVERTYGEDPAGLPRVKTMCAVSSEDLIIYRDILETLGRTLAETDQGRLLISNETLFKDITGGGHIMGTTRMGEDPASSVVDANCKVHNYANLYVAGSSVFSSGGASNPTLTLVALASRLTDHLTGDA